MTSRIRNQLSDAANQLGYGYLDYKKNIALLKINNYPQ